MNINIPKRGKLITLEGIDGAGKSIHTSSIMAWVKQQGFHVIATREPGGTDLGEQIRQWILYQETSSLTELLLIFAARSHHIHQIIEPALSRGDWVICDRFTDSTLAYQGGGRGMNKAIIEQLSTILNSNIPDLTLIFDVDLTIAKQRIFNRQSETHELSDKFENASQSFVQSVQQAYQSIALNNPQRCILIDTQKHLHAVHHDIINGLNGLV